MANLYAQPIESKFINTHVPIPFEQMQQAGQMIQERYDKGASALNAMVAQTENYTGIGKDRARMEAYQQAVKDLSTQYTQKNLGDTFVINDLLKDVRKAVPVADVKDIMASKAAWEQAQKEKQDLASKNLWNPLLDEDPGDTWDSSGGKIYNYRPSAYIDKEQVWGDYFKNMGPDYVKPANVNGLDVMEQGISMSKVEKTAADLTNQMVGTPQGVAYLKQWHKLNPGKEDADPNKIMYDEMLSVGRPFATKHFTPLPEGYLKRMSGENQNVPFDNSQHTRKPAESQIAGDTEGERIKNMQKQIEENRKLAQSAPVGSPEKTKYEGLAYKDEQDLARVKAQTVSKYKSELESVKKQAVSLFKQMPIFSGKSDKELNDLIDERLSPGFVGGLSRFGDWEHNTVDQVMGLPVQGAGLIANVVNMLASSFDTSTRNKAIAKAVKDQEIGKNWKLSDIFGAAIKTVGELYNSNKTDATTLLEQDRSKDRFNVFRETTKKIKNLEEKIESESYSSLLKERNYAVSGVQSYPIVTQEVDGTRYIVPPTSKTRGIASNIDRVHKDLWNNISHFEVRQVDDKGTIGDVLKKDKDISKAKEVMSMWNRTGAIGNLDQDENGNLVFKVGFTPKTEKQGTSGKSYEIKVAPGSNEYWNLIDDYRLSGDQIAYNQLANIGLKKDVENKIYQRGGGIVDIRYPDGALQEFKVEYKDGEHLLSNYQNGQVSETKKYPTLQELTQDLFKLQLLARNSK